MAKPLLTIEHPSDGNENGQMSTESAAAYTRHGRRGLINPAAAFLIRRLPSSPLCSIGAGPSRGVMVPVRVRVASLGCHRRVRRGPEWPHLRSGKWAIKLPSTRPRLVPARGWTMPVEHGHRRSDLRPSQPGIHRMSGVPGTSNWHADGTGSQEVRGFEALRLHQRSLRSVQRTVAIGSGLA
jgi:hypothetical protein